MTFADVARRVGLNTTSVTYYFKRKDDLAAACFEHTLDTLMAMLDEAQREPTPETRVSRYLATNLERFARIECGEGTAFAVRSEEPTSELRSLMRSSYAVFCLKKQNTDTDTRLTCPAHKQKRHKSKQ